MANEKDPQAEPPIGNLTGNFHVRILRETLKAGHRLFPRTKDRMEFRRHLLKLRYWPQRNPVDQNGVVLDLDWEKVRALADLDVFELRVDDVIGGHNNLRAYFYVAEKRDRDPLRCIWILHAMQKKRNALASQDLVILRARRKVVRTLFYGDSR